MYEWIMTRPHWRLSLCFLLAREKQEKAWWLCCSIQMENSEHSSIWDCCWGRAGEKFVSRLTNLLEMKSDQTTTNEFVCITFFKWMQLFTCNMTWNKYYGLKQKFLHFSNFYKFTNYYSSESVVTVNITPCYNLLSTKSKSHFLALLTMKIKPSGLSEVERPSSEAQDIYPVNHFNPSNQVSNKVLLAGFKINLVKQFI